MSPPGCSRRDESGRCRRDERRSAPACMLLCLAAASALAQPDPRQMSGIPRPDPNLSDGSITVRVIRGSFANQRGRTGGRAAGRRPGVDGGYRRGGPGDVPDPEPGRAGDGGHRARRGSCSTRCRSRRRAGAAWPSCWSGRRGDPGDADARPEARPGRVTLSQESRILIELGEEQIEVYYLLDVFNQSPWPVEPELPFEFQLPPGAQAGTVLGGSTPRTLVDGPRVWVQGAFEPGVTPVQVACILPYSGDGSCAVAGLSRGPRAAAGLRREVGDHGRGLQPDRPAGGDGGRTRPGGRPCSGAPAGGSRRGGAGGPRADWPALSQRMAPHHRPEPVGPHRRHRRPGVGGSRGRGGAGSARGVGSAVARSCSPSS